MIRMFISWIIITLAILLATVILPGIRVSSIGSAFLAAAVLGILNAFVKPILVFFTLPITLITMGLFLLVINALMFYLAGAIVDGLQIKSFWWALLGSLVVSVVSVVAHSIGL